MYNTITLTLKQKLIKSILSVHLCSVPLKLQTFQPYIFHCLLYRYFNTLMYNDGYHVNTTSVTG